MNKMILVIQQSLHSIFLNRKTTQDIHDIKNRYTATALKGTISAKKARQIIEKTASYKIGLSAGRFK